MSLTTRVLIALVLGIVAGLVIRAYPAPALLSLVSFVEPIGTLWVNAIRMTVVPLVVSLLVTGVASSRDMTFVRTTGVRTLVTFVALLILCGIVGLLIVPPMFSWLTIDAATVASLRGSASAPPPAAETPGFVDWVLTIIPTNPVRAAADGAILPLVVFALAFGLGLLTIAAERRANVVTFFAGVGDAMLAIVSAIIALAPIGVFALILPLASRTGLAAAGALAYYIAIMAIAQMLFLLMLYPIVAVAGGIPMLRFGRAALNSQAVAFASSSSLASLPALIDGADHGLRLPVNVSGVVLPLAVSAFKIGGPMIFLIAAVFLGHLYGVSLTFTQLLTVALTGIVASFAAPGVPHGWLLVVTPVVVAMGIPAEGVGLLIAVDAVPDLFATMLNVTGDLAAAAIVSRGFTDDGAAAVPTAS
jgi:proton glutamate symport protein